MFLLHRSEAILRHDLAKLGAFVHDLRPPPPPPPHQMDNIDKIILNWPGGGGVPILRETTTS